MKAPDQLLADVIQGLECLLAKQNVAGSIPAIRSLKEVTMPWQTQFGLDADQEKKLNQWYAQLKEEYTGAIGGRLTFCFTPTGIGTVVIVKDAVTKKEIDLTDYDSW